MFTIEFRTKRLSIRPVTTEDAPFILELMNTPKWIKNISDRNVNTIEDVEAYIIEKAFPQLKNLVTPIMSSSEKRIIKH